MYGPVLVGFLHPMKLLGRTVFEISGAGAVNFPNEWLICPGYPAHDHGNRWKEARRRSTQHPQGTPAGA
jgi:hypothetical protein